MVSPIVDLRSVAYRRGSHVVFSELTLRCLPGQVTAVMGPSGTGKTTLLKLITGQLKPDAGTVTVAGQDLNTLSQTALFDCRKKMGMLFQQGGLFSDLSVFENVAFPLRQHTDLSEDMIRDAVLLKLEAVGLRGAASLMPSELSGGMTRRVALARAVVMDPDLILYDEPFAGQDPISMGILTRLIRQLSEQLALTTIVVSHDVQEVAQISDYVYVLADGRVVGEGKPEAVLQSQQPAVYQFIHGLVDGPVSFHYPCEPLAEALL